MAAQRPLPWSLKGVSREARDAARAAAQREGIPVGAWLSRVIREIAAAEAAATRRTGANGAEDAGRNSIERAAARLGPSREDSDGQ